MPSPAAPAAFISYSREDSEFALRLARDLKSAGANVWLDQMDIQPGLPWDNAVEEALAQAPQMLLILSPASSKSNNVRNEISFALDEGKIVVPVMYQDCAVPLHLRRTQRIDFRNDYPRGLTALLSYLGVTQPNQAVLEDADKAEAQRLSQPEAARPQPEADAAKLRPQEAEPQQLRATSPGVASNPSIPSDKETRTFMTPALLTMGGAIVLILSLVYFAKQHDERQQVRDSSYTADKPAPSNPQSTPQTQQPPQKPPAPESSSAAHETELQSWTSGKVYGSDDQAAASRAVYITGNDGAYSAHILNQFDFTCTLSFDSKGQPAQLSNCVSGPNGHGWYPQNKTIPLRCSISRSEKVCQGAYKLCDQVGAFCDDSRMLIARKISTAN